MARAKTARLILKQDDNVGMSGTREQSRSHILQLFWLHKRLQVLILELCSFPLDSA